MAIVTLESKSATLVPGAGKANSRQSDAGSSLIVNVGFSRNTGIWLTGQKKMFEGDLSLSIREATAEGLTGITELTRDIEARIADAEIVGGMAYSAPRQAGEGQSQQRAAILFDVFVPRKDMASLVKLSRSGRYPRKAWIDVKGLSYRTSRRDSGAQLAWEKHTEQWMLPIVHVSFEVPLHAHGEFTFGVTQASREEADKRSARSIERLLEPLFFRMSGRLVWIVWILVAGVVGLAFWFWR